MGFPFTSIHHVVVAAEGAVPQVVVAMAAPRDLSLSSLPMTSVLIDWLPAFTDYPGRLGVLKCH